MPTLALRGGVALAAACAAALTPAAARAATTTALPADASVDAAAGAWTGASTCALLCASDAGWSATAGTGGGGGLAMRYATLANIRGTAAGSASWTSGAFTWDGADVTAAAVRLDRRADVGTLLGAGGIARLRLVLLDVTAGTQATAADQALGQADPAFTAVAGPVAPGTLVAGHAYRLRVRSDFAAAVTVPGGARIDVDNARLEVTTAATPAAPAVAAVGPDAATLTATLAPGASYHVEYGTSDFADRTAEATAPAGADAGPRSIALAGLQAGTEYQARLVVRRGDTVARSAVATFRTDPSGRGPDTAPAFAPGVPEVHPTSTGVALAASAAPGSESGSWYVQYGPRGAWHARTAGHATAADAGTIALAETVDGLEPGTEYQARFVLATATVTVYGETIAFRTAAAPVPVPSAAVPAVDVTADGATLSTSVTPGTAATWYVEYGLEGGFGRQTTPRPLDAADRLDAVLTGLDPDTAYQARFVLVADGTAHHGETVHFRTAEAGTSAAADPTAGAGAALVDTNFTPTTPSAAKPALAASPVGGAATAGAPPAAPRAAAPAARASARVSLDARRRLRATVTGARPVTALTLTLPRGVTRAGAVTLTAGGRRLRVAPRGGRRTVTLTGLPAVAGPVVVTVRVRGKLTAGRRRAAARAVTIRLAYADGTRSGVLRTVG